jgi:hypothetical protein
MIGGGRDNEIANNIFLDCDDGVFLDQRGKDWPVDFLYGPIGMMARLQSVHYDQAPYSTRYPLLASIFKMDALAAHGNSVTQNILISSRVNLNGVFANYIGNSLGQGYANVLSTPLAFQNFVNQLQVPLPQGFTPIAIDQIGVPDSNTTDLTARYGPNP